MTLPKIPYKETRCAEHFNAGVTKASWSVHNECNECRKPVCFDCGKPKMGAWMSGVCDDCYRIHDRALRRQEADEKQRGREAILKVERVRELLWEYDKADGYPDPATICAAIEKATE
ncbi:hypothetical protein KHQ84_gp142 [Rhodococcus phage Finch]|uniref:Uncharacterized protein n=1 Tax=Rhodococcus phage Finch TaxID=2094144 RepID=A0A2P1JXM9_9CAUD|nr:hypothetical protein KHQ84_gp142 [Rhodococcus phage Finch]AVO25072.1 hypothetical protein SEA_FINCH_142 [Rhodococcus phage Finch]